MNIAAIEEACVELITKHAFPLCFVDFPAFKRIIEPYAIALERQETKLIITKERVRQLVTEKADQIRKEIIDETKGRFVSVMIDIATRHNRSILGVNIRYMNSSDKFVIRTVGMYPLRISHSGQNIRDIVLDILRKHGISNARLFSVTTDNGRNIINAVALIDANYQNEKMEEQLTDDNMSDDDSDFDIDTDILDSTCYADLLQNARSQFRQLQYNDLIHGISCAAHCFHLILTKAFDKCKEVEELFVKCRELTKKLRSPTFRQLIDLANLNHAKIDVVTRWNSIYLMVCLLQ